MSALTVKDTVAMGPYPPIPERKDLEIYDHWHRGEGTADLYRDQGHLAINGHRVKLLFERLESDPNPHAGKLFRVLATTQPLNANLLDYLLNRQELIPETWKKLGHIPFSGTIYRSMLNRWVPCLLWCRYRRAWVRTYQSLATINWKVSAILD